MLYLSAQIRDQSTQARQHNHQSAIDGFVRYYADVRSSEDQVELYIKAVESYEKLSTAGKTRVDALMLNLVAAWDNVLRLHESVLLDEHENLAMQNLIARIVKSPGISQWWKREMVYYPAPVRDGVNDALTRHADTPSEYERWVENQ